MKRNTAFVLGLVLSLSGCAREESIEPLARPEVEAPNEPQPAKRYSAYRGTTCELPAADATVHKLTAQEFHEAIEDADTSRKKYAGSWIEVTGELFSYQVAPYNMSREVILTATIRPPAKQEGNSLNVDFVNCWVAAGEQPWQQAGCGATVTFRGAFAQMSGQWGYVAEAKIVDVQGDPMPMMTVDELFGNIASDPESFVKKCDPQDFDGFSQTIVTGEFADFQSPANEEDADTNEWVALKGANEQLFHSFVGGDKYLFEGAEVGDRVAVLGSFLVLRPDDLEGETLSSATNLTPFVQ